MRPGRVVADVSVHIGVDEVLRRHGEVGERRGEIGPIARLVQLEERHDRPVVVVERRPAEGERLDWRRFDGSVGSGVIGVDGVGDERPVARETHLDVDRFAALDLDLFVNETQRLGNAPKFRGVARLVQPLAIEILHVRGDVGLAPGDMPIPADGDGGRARQGRTDHLEVSTREMRQIPE